VKITDALIVAGVEILDGRDAILVCRRTEGVKNFPGQTRVFDTPLAAGRVVLAFKEMIDMLAKVRPYIVLLPAG